MKEETIKTIKNNEIVLCRVSKIGKTYFEVVTSFGKKGVVFINEVSDYFVKDLDEIVQMNNILYLVIKGEKDGKLLLSFKENRSEFLKTPFEFSIKKTNLNFENLYTFTNKEIAKWKK